MKVNEYIEWFKNFVGIQSDSEYKNDFWMDGLDMVEAAMKFELEFSCIVDDDKMDQMQFENHEEFINFLISQK